MQNRPRPCARSTPFTRRISHDANPLLHRQRFALALLFGLALPLLAQANEPLPSWNDGPAKKSIIEFVQAVTDQTSKDFVKPGDRIAVFDNDGTLWSEQPAYFELLFAFDEVKRTARNTRNGRPPSRSRRCWKTITRPWPRPAWTAC
jgi:hypothetical protein